MASVSLHCDVNKTKPTQAMRRSENGHLFEKC